MNKILILTVILFFSLGCNMLSNLTSESTDEPTSTETETTQTETPQTSSTEAENEASTQNVSNEKDLLSIGAGAYLIKVSSEYTPDEVGRWSAFGLIDESKKIGWAGKSKNVTDQSIVFELPAKTTFKKIGFDTANVDTEGSAAKEVSVEISDTSPDSGFETILSTTLKDKTDGQNFPVEKEVAGRYVKINAKNNFGAEEWLEIMEVRGYGEQETMKPLEDVSGTYKSRYGNFRIKQEGTSIVGCYEYQSGLLNGGIDGKIMTLTWKEEGEGDSNRGPAVFLFDKEAKKFLGLWGYANGDYYSGKWDGEKISDEVGNCEHFKNLSEENAAGSQLEEELKKDGRATVYGINFDFNSDKIKDESKTTLDQIVGILKENSDWKMTVEGHTDNVGGETFNQTLSEKRANAVKKYLVDAGIDESRLTAKGLGMSKPIAKNDTEAGRARNRRVELVKQ